MKGFRLLIILLIVGFSACRQPVQPVERPKLVVGIVVDQMRWDYIYRYYDRYGNNGFKRLLREGYSCQNTMVNYLPSYTAPGHTCIYTGSVPAIHGIAGNDWIDNQTGRSWYCTEDTGDGKKPPYMSPRNLLATTITDEVRLATNLASRVYGVAIKDRGAILPAGHMANGAYWYDDKTGDFVSSEYYGKNQNPEWLRKFNKRYLANKLTQLDWTLLKDEKSYKQSTKDNTEYEQPLKGETAPVFPHAVSKMPKPERLKLIKSLPAGNELTLQMARACIDGADGGKLGGGKDMDFLCVSLSSTDYVGHAFAPNSMETEDIYLRLDNEIASFLGYLDRTVGEGNYLLFLTADHGGAHNARFLTDHGVPAGIWPDMTKALNDYLHQSFATDSPIVRNIANYQVAFNESILSYDKSIKEQVKTTVTNWLLHIMPQQYNVPVAWVVDMDDINRTPLPEPIKTMAINGYNRNRSGSLQIILNPGWYESDKPTGTTHGSWNPYDTHIPLLWYGWHIPNGETYNPINMTDIAPTLAALLHVQMPSGCIGKPINEMLKK